MRYEIILAARAACGYIFAQSSSRANIAAQSKHLRVTAWMPRRGGGWMLGAPALALMKIIADLRKNNSAESLLFWPRK